jgi:hypothetical protein
MAFGAQAHNVLVLAQGMKLVLLGAIIAIPVTRGGASVIEFVDCLDDNRCAHHRSRYSIAGSSDSARVLFASATRNESRSVGHADTSEPIVIFWTEDL